jgi:hypothetical protein
MHKPIPKNIVLELQLVRSSKKSVFASSGTYNLYFKSLLLASSKDGRSAANLEVIKDLNFSNAWTNTDYFGRLRSDNRFQNYAKAFLGFFQVITRYPIPKVLLTIPHKNEQLPDCLESYEPDIDADIANNFHNKLPIYNENTQEHQLDFHGKASVPSVKNIIMIDPET